MRRKAVPLVCLTVFLVGLSTCRALRVGTNPASPDAEPHAPAAAPAAAPGKLVARENPARFRKAFDDETASVKIGLRNAGGQPLRLRGVRGSCGCMRVGAIPDTIPPGQEVEVEFAIRLAGMSGRVAKLARVFSDDPATPELRIGIEGEVGPRFVIEPGRAMVTRSAPGAPATADVLVRSGGDLALDELTAVASVPGVTVEKTMHGPVARLHVVVPAEIEHPRGTITLRLDKHERVIRLTDGSTAAGVVAAPTASGPRPKDGDEGSAREGAGVLAVAFSGQDLGELEPCGCTQGMLGGIARRPARLRAFLEPGLPFVAVSGGALVAGTDAYDRLRYSAFAAALGAMGVAALAPARRELALGAGLADPTLEHAPPPLVAVDVDEDSVGDRDLQRMLRLEPDGSTFVYVTGVSGAAGESALPGLTFVDPRQALRELRGELPVFAPLVVLTNVGEEAARELARHAGRPTLVLYAGGWTDPGPEDVEEGPMAFAPYPAEGKFVGLARLHGRGGSAGWTVEFRPVDVELPEDATMLELRQQHRAQMRAADLVVNAAASARFTPAALSGEAEPAAAPAGAYAGSAACTDCHAQAARNWAESKHAHALDTLRRSGDDADPACVACHVVGYGTGRGFSAEARTPHLAGVGCEACHGPRAEHVALRTGAARRGGAPEPPTRAGRLACISCHNGKHDPNFNFETYWPRIAHDAR